MSRRLSPSLLAALALALPPGSTRAQQNDTAAEEEQASPSSETEGTDVRDGAAAAPRGRESAPGEVHTVEKGDTLWDLSQRYLGSPWYWPKVWSYNPEIANPHWIYPGNQVRFFSAGEEQPSRVEAGATSEPVAESDGLEAPILLDEEADNQVHVTGKIGYSGPGARRVVHEGFVSAKQMEDAGRIEASFSESFMMSYPDTVYVRFKNRSSAKVGDRFIIFRTGQEIKHPVTGRTVGHLTDFLGLMTVTAVSNNLVTAQIGRTWADVVRGDLVGVYNERLVETVAPRPNERQLEGIVVTTLVPYLTIYGEHHEMVIDKGSADGVQLGNTFTVMRQSDLGGNFMDPSKGQNSQLPIEDVATCMVVDAREHTSNCVLTRSIREVVPGDRVQMRAGNRPTAQR